VLRLAGAAALSGRWIKQARNQAIERYSWLLVLALASGGSLWFGFSNLHDLTAPGGSDLIDALVFTYPIAARIITVTVIVMIQQASRRALWEARQKSSQRATAFILAEPTAQRFRRTRIRWLSVTCQAPRSRTTSPSTKRRPWRHFLGLYAPLGLFHCGHRAGCRAVIALTK
jgi:hypothetical protein